MAHQAYHPGVSFFIKFYNLDPSKNNQCIFYTQKGGRCNWPGSDNGRATRLRETIIAASGETVNLDLLQEYILCNCCKLGKAQHRDRIEDFDLLLPLAQRWQDEIRSHAADQFNHAASVPALTTPATPTPSHTTTLYAPTGSPLHHQANVPAFYGISAISSGPIVNPSSSQYGSPIPSAPALGNSTFNPYVYTTPVTPTPSHTRTLSALASGPLHYQADLPTSLRGNVIHSGPVASPSSYQYSSEISAITSEIASVHLGNQSRHDLRSHEANISTNSTASSSSYRRDFPRPPTTMELASQNLGSQPHYDVSPREANISTNSASVGPTSISQAPLSEFRVHVPNPLRRHSVSRIILDPLEERDLQTGSLYIFYRDSSPGYVKIGWTAKSVQERLEEWSQCGFEAKLLFEVNRVPHAQRAETLTHHELIKEWRREKKCPGCETPHQEWEMVTGKSLLEHFEGSLVEEATIVEKPVDLGQASRVGYGDVPKARRQETPKEALVHEGSRRIEQPLTDSSAPLIVGIMKGLLSLSTDELEEIAKTLTSITQRQQNVEKSSQVEPKNELLGYDGQTREKEIDSHDEDENTATEDEAERREDGWDIDATLVQDQIQCSLEKTAVKIADGLSNEFSTGKVTGVLNGWDGLKVLESEAPPAVEVVAQA